MNEIDIGSKIKKSRLDAKLTQEDAAESLHVSRQTISNWENGKTYPDIISVIRMSDLYSVSLDLLLKGENSMAKNYIEYLAESTDVVKSKRRLGQVIVCSISLLIWVLAMIVFWFFTSEVDAAGYSLMFMFLILPLDILITSFIFGFKNYWGKLKFILPVVNGILFMLSEMATFGFLNRLYNLTYNANNPLTLYPHMQYSYFVTGDSNISLMVDPVMPDYTLLIAGIIISLIGIGIGIGIRALINARKKKNGNSNNAGGDVTANVAGDLPSTSV